ncbi:unnamed protein product [Musa textilis]
MIRYWMRIHQYLIMLDHFLVVRSGKYFVDHVGANNLWNSCLSKLAAHSYWITSIGVSLFKYRFKNLNGFDIVEQKYWGMIRYWKRIHQYLIMLDRFLVVRSDKYFVDHIGANNLWNSCLSKLAAHSYWITSIGASLFRCRFKNLNGFDIVEQKGRWMIKYWKRIHQYLIMLDRFLTVRSDKYFVDHGGANNLWNSCLSKLAVHSY